MNRLPGILAVVVLGLIETDLVLSYSNPIHLPGGVTWLFPWSAPDWRSCCPIPPAS